MPEKMTREPRENLQIEYMKVPKGSVGEQADFLLSNMERNRRYCERKLLELFPLIEKALNDALADRAKMIKAAVESRILYDYYVEFDRLSERQRTKIGGFKGFVKAQFEKETEYSSYEQPPLLRRLLSRAQRTYYDDRGTEARDFGDPPRFRSQRENYLNSLSLEEKAVADAAARSTRYAQIFREIEKRLGIQDEDREDMSN
ncbi:hypothetical protein HY626_00410 [Candidatus Uhrbacteria bacterium]|nr:hypothetical protein [Candidatus Uhrbacteria bacterium]